MLWLWLVLQSMAIRAAAGDNATATAGGSLTAAAHTHPPGPPGRPVSTRSKRLRHQHQHQPTPEEREAANVLSVLLFIMVSSQYALFAWKQRHFASYQYCTLIGLWVFPVLFSLWFRFWKFLGCWLAYSLSTSYFVRLATSKPLPRGAPASVYRWFSTVHHTTHIAALTGYFVGMLDSFGLSPFVLLASVFYGPVHMPPHLPRDEHGVLLPLPPGVAAVKLMREICAMLLFYGLYFGVLTRDVAEVSTQRISTALGLGKKVDDDMMSDWARKNTCALCSCDLHPEHALVPAHPALQHGRGGESAPAPKAVTRPEPLFELRCGHIFHESCIRGWAIVGKHNTCPYCAAPVDLSLILGNSPWQKQSLIWLRLLDGVRYLIVWHPMILALAHVLLHWLFPHHVFGHPPPHAHVAGSPAAAVGTGPS